MSMGLMKWIYGGLCCRDLINELVARLVDESAGAEKRELPRHFLRGDKFKTCWRIGWGWGRGESSSPYLCLGESPQRSGNV
jgi:hypothetical protein